MKPNGSRRALATGTGLIVILLYLLGASLSGRMSVLARRPLLDGFAPPPPYQWVSPPPALASANKPPSAGHFKVDLDQARGSSANVFTTADGQVSLALAQSAIPPKRGEASVKLTMTPLAPRNEVTLASGLQITGNVYRLTAAYSQSGAAIPRLARPGQLVLAYPVTSTRAGGGHTVLRSSDGRSWTALRTTDAFAQQLAQADVTELGYFAVAQSLSATSQPAGSGRHTIYLLIMWGAFGAVVLAVIITEARHRRARRKPSVGRGPRRKPPPRKRLDPWE